jgi:peptidyl-prolyl cis-trans isomerase C
MIFILVIPTLYAGDEDPVIAEAGDYVIKQSDLDRQISYLTPDKQKHLRENPQQLVTLIKRTMQIKIISGLARGEGLEKQSDVSERLQYMVDDFLSREYISKVVVRDITVTDEDIEQYYRLNKEKFLVPEQVKARHILIRVSPDESDEEKNKALEKARDILKKAKEGEDFAKLAEKYSDDLGSRQRGGDLGFFDRGRMVKPFEDAAFSLKPGEMSEIVETRFGYHIIKVEDYHESRSRKIEEVKDIIKKQLKDELTRAKATEFIKITTESAGLKIHADRIKR